VIGKYAIPGDWSWSGSNPVTEPDSCAPSGRQRYVSRRTIFGVNGTPRQDYARSPLFEVRACS